LDTVFGISFYFSEGSMRILFVLMALFLSACATSYQPDGYSGGYRDRQVGDNQYLVSFRGNGFTKQATVEDYAFRRAQEICEQTGFRRFQLLSKDGSRKEEAIGQKTASCTSSGYRTGSYYNTNAECTESEPTTLSKHSVELLITCVK
jgi:hypothetical protein